MYRRIITNFFISITIFTVSILSSCDFGTTFLSEIQYYPGKSLQDQDFIIGDEYQESIVYTIDNNGIHITVGVDEDKKYSSFKLYYFEGLEEYLCATIEPTQPYIYFMKEDSYPCGPTIYDVTESKTDENEIEKDKVDVEASYRTNYLAAGNITFDLCFLEPGKTYTFAICAEEDEGIYVDVTTTPKTEKKFRDYTGSSGTRTKIRHFTKAFTITSGGQIRDINVNSTYNRDKDEFTTKKFTFLDKDFPFNIKKEEDAHFTAEFIYQRSKDDKLGSFSIPFSNLEDEESVHLSRLLEAVDYAAYETDYILTEAVATLGYTEAMNLQIADCDTSDKLLAYYKELYGKKTYEYSNLLFFPAGVPATVNVPDNRMPVTVEAIPDGNKISFELPEPASFITIYRTDISLKNSNMEGMDIGTIGGNFVENQIYSFTDYLVQAGETASYQVRFNERKSKCSSVTTSSEVKYMPDCGVSSYDTDTWQYILDKHPFEKGLPEQYYGEMNFDYKCTNRNSTTMWYDDISVSIYSNKKYPEIFGFSSSYYSKMVYKISDSVEINLSAYIDNYCYKNYRTFSDTFGFCKKIVVTPDYYYTEPPKNETFGDEENTKYPEEEINEYKKQHGFQFAEPDRSDVIKITSLEEISDGVKVNIYIPEWIGAVVLERYNNEHDGTPSACYYFDVEKMKKGNVSIVDYVVQADKTYYYGLSYMYRDGEGSLFDRKSITVTNSAGYGIGTLPKITITSEGMEIPETENKVSFKTLPSGYKDLRTYDNSLTSLSTEYGYIEDYSFSYYVKTNLRAKFQLVTYMCTEIDDTDRYFEDIYGNKSEKIYTDKQLTRYIKWNGTKWYLVTSSMEEANFYSIVTPKEYNIIKGKYTAISAETGFWNENGLWIYSYVPVLTNAENRTFLYKE